MKPQDQTTRRRVDSPRKAKAGAGVVSASLAFSGRTKELGALGEVPRIPLRLWISECGTQQTTALIRQQLSRVARLHLGQAPCRPQGQLRLPIYLWVSGPQGDVAVANCEVGER